MVQVFQKVNKKYPEPDKMPTRRVWTVSQKELVDSNKLESYSVRMPDVQLPHLALRVA